MSDLSEKLLKSFVELCEELVSEAYVITDGRAVLTAVLDHDVATKLCKLTISKTGDPSWKVARIADAIELAFRKGFEEGYENSHKEVEDIEASK